MQLPFFYNNEHIAEEEGVLNEATSKHVAQVLRMQSGEQLQLTNGRGLIQTAEILQEHKKHTAVKILSVSQSEPSKKNITIAISPVKNISRFEWFLEKATEIGVQHIIPLLCSRSERSQFRFERMENILISAMLQSRQSWLPELHLPRPFNKTIADFNTPNKFIAHCIDSSSKSTLASSLQKVSDNRIILIGPEGDFTQQEVDLAISKEYKPVSLGENRLRTETAGIVACIIMNVV